MKTILMDVWLWALVASVFLYVTWCLYLIKNGFPVGQNNQELELLTKRVDTLTEITEIFGPILERLDTFETKMSNLEKEVK